MSGGSWNYAYFPLNETSRQIRACVKEQAEARASVLYDRFGTCFSLLGKAMHDIEWVDSGDMGRGDDIGAIMEALETDLRAVLGAAPDVRIDCFMTEPSWEEVYAKLVELVEGLEQESDPLRKRLGQRMDRVSEAVLAIIKIESDEAAPGTEYDAIIAALAPG